MSQPRPFTASICYQKCHALPFVQHGRLAHVTMRNPIQPRLSHLLESIQTGHQLFEAALEKEKKKLHTYRRM